MGISIDLSNSQFGIPFTGAYFRVVTAAITYQRGGARSVMIDVSGYATPPTNDDTREIDFRRYHAPYADVEAQPGANFIARCYNWVMDQPDMAGSAQA